MQRIIGMIILVFWGASAMFAQQYHYIYKGEQVPLELNTEYAYLVLDDVENPSALTPMLGSAKVTNWGVHNPGQTLNEVPGAVASKEKSVWVEVRFLRPQSSKSYQEQLDKWEATELVRYVAPFFKNDKQEKIGLSDLFVVKLQALGDEAVLLKMAAENNVQVVGRNRFMPDWYTLQVTERTSGTALDMANAFYASGLFAAAEPDLMVDVANCVNDPLFKDQWGHQNTGQNGWTSGMDIRACDGWANWGTGSSGVVVAVLDHGYEQNHPDLVANNVGTGFDTESGASPALVLGSHGTACTGIVAATQNNNLGVSGVAPDCGLMSISNSLFGNPNSRQKRADGINWAWQKGAAVISNSWVSGVQYQVIDDAIENAQKNGRGGLGTVIVFAAGNGNSPTVRYPANANPDVIAVGAMSPCGERKQPGSCDGESWGSDYGTELDVVAPGVKIPTTDRQGSAGYASGDYAPAFNGTSSACPHVAGLAGLLISLNPCLTQRQVADIIERSARKVGAYTYSATAGRENGGWNNEMGYGLIDVDRAMQMCRELLLQNETVSSTEIYQVHGTIAAGSNVDPSQPVGPYTVASGGNVTFAASGMITLAAGFNVNSGAVFSTKSISTNCSDWDQSAKMFNPADAVGESVDDEQLDVARVTLGGENQVSVSPNPFKDKLVLHMGLVESAQVGVSLYNLHGQQVAELLPESRQRSGNYQKDFELASGMPDGIYILRVVVDGVSTTHKLLKQ